MASKADFTPAEWQTLQWSVTDTMTYVSMDRGLWATFQEAQRAARYIEGVKMYSRNVLVSQLASDIGLRRDKAVTDDPGNVAGEVTRRVGEAAGIVSSKAPEDVEAFKQFIVGVAEAATKDAKGINSAEATAISRLRAALD